MIHRIEIQNYKSLRDVRLDVGKCNVLIGPNNSGKSNIMDSLLFLSETSHKSLPEVLLSRGDYGSVTFGGQSGWIKFAVHSRLTGKECKYTLVCSGGDIKEEMLFMDGQCKIQRSAGVTDVMDDAGEAGPVEVPGSVSAVSIYSRKEGYHSIKEFQGYLASWKMYHFASTQEMRSRSDARRVSELDKTGKNLIQVLLSLRTATPEIFDSIEDYLRQGIPEIENVLTPITSDGRAHLAIREQGFERDFDCSHLSDGTLKFLAYITAATLPGDGVICLEEPENSVHPRLLNLIVDIFRKSDRQIIFSTHSPYMANYVQPKEMIVVKKTLGETQAIRIANNHILRDTLRTILS